MASFDVTQHALVGNPEAAAAIGRQLDAQPKGCFTHWPALDDDGEPTSKVAIALRMTLPSTSHRDAERAVESLLQGAADSAGAAIEMTESESLHTGGREHPT